MIDGGSAVVTDRGDPAVRLTGLPARELGRTALAGLVAEAFAVAFMGATAAATTLVLPTCEGDSCIGSPRLWADVALSPLVVLLALAAAFTVRRLRRPWLLAGVALPVALLLLGTGASALLGALPALGPAAVVLVVAGVLFGPLAAVAAGALVHGRRPAGWVPAAVVVLLAVGLVVAHVLLGPSSRAAAVTAAAPQPYAYEAPRARLNALNVNGYTNVLELGYVVGAPSGDELDESFVDLHETGPVPAAARAADCSPALPLGEPQNLCHRLVTPSGVTVWRPSAGADPQLVVALPDATVTVFADVPDDAAAVALVGRLVPVEASRLLADAGSVSVP